MDKLIEASDVNQVHFISSTGFTVSAGTNYASHVFVKAGERTKGRLVYNTTGGYFVDFDVAAGTVGVETAFSGGSVVAGSAKITALPGGIYKISAVGYGASGTSAVIKVEMQDGSGNRQYNGDGTSGIYLWGMDCQLGSVDGPYIPTTSAQVTRAAPSLSIALSGFAFNSTEGSVYVEADGNPSATSGAMMFEIGDGTSGNRMLAYFNAGSGAAQWVVVAGSVNQAVLSVGAATIGAQSRMMASFKANNIVASVNGGSVVTDTSATVPSVTNLYLGYSPSSATTYLNGHLSKVALFPRQLSNNEHISASTQ